MAQSQSPLVGNALTGVRCTITPGSGDCHLRLTFCDDCNARELLGLSLGQVERLYHQGLVRQAMFEAYCHMWATGVPRLAALPRAWTASPSDPEVIALVALFHGLISERR